VDLPSRWRWTWEALGSAPAPGLFDELVARYSERHRRYHTVAHLQECFEQFDLLSSLAEQPVEVALALWFHDAIYEPRRGDNEQRSAHWAKRAVPPERAERVHGLVMATRHKAVPADVDEQVLVDVDLSILGAPPARFDEYEAQIREEYAWVPAFVYRRKRRDLLQGFLARASVFNTAAFIGRYEQRARENLARSLARL
jgi:predicted metal-dependent HD superfamily phosphohydrolase